MTFQELETRYLFPLEAMGYFVESVTLPNSLWEGISSTAEKDGGCDMRGALALKSGLVLIKSDGERMRIQIFENTGKFCPKWKPNA